MQQPSAPRRRTNAVPIVRVLRVPPGAVRLSFAKRVPYEFRRHHHCAVTGDDSKVTKSPHCAVTPQEIAATAIAAAKAGAAIVHIHVRDPDTGAFSMETKHYREVVKLIQESKVDVIVNLTCGMGGYIVVGDIGLKDTRPPARTSAVRKTACGM